MKVVPLASTTALVAGAILLAAAPSFAQPGVADSGAAAQAGAGQTGPGDAPRGGGRGREGPITLAQYQARFRERTMRADADHDGRVSLAEWTAARAAHQSGGYGGGGQGYGGGRGDPARQFQMMDANGDGYLTPAEIDAVSAERFARLDADHDGVLTPDERMAMRHGGPGEDESASPPSPR